MDALLAEEDPGSIMAGWKLYKHDGHQPQFELAQAFSISVTSWQQHWAPFQILYLNSFPPTLFPFFKEAMSVRLHDFYPTDYPQQPSRLSYLSWFALVELWTWIVFNTWYLGGVLIFPASTHPHLLGAHFLSLYFKAADMSSCGLTKVNLNVCKVCSEHQDTNWWQDWGVTSCAARVDKAIGYLRNNICGWIYQWKLSKGKEAHGEGWLIRYFEGAAWERDPSPGSKWKQ